MTHICIERQLAMTDEEIRQVAVRVEDKLAREYGVQFRWQGNRAAVKGPGVDGSCNVQDGTIAINLKLGFLLMPFKTAIEKKINAYLDKLTTV